MEDILKNLVSEEYTGETLIAKFSKRDRKMRGEVKSMISETDKATKNPNVPKTDVDSLFSGD